MLQEHLMTPMQLVLSQQFTGEDKDIITHYMYSCLLVSCDPIALRINNTEMYAVYCIKKQLFHIQNRVFSLRRHRAACNVQAIVDHVMERRAVAFNAQFTAQAVFTRLGL